MSILQEPPRALRAIRPDVSPELEAIIGKCLMKDKAQRFQRIGDLSAALSRHLHPVALEVTVMPPQTASNVGPGSSSTSSWKSRSKFPVTKPPPAMGNADEIMSEDFISDPSEGTLSSVGNVSHSALRLEPARRRGSRVAMIAGGALVAVATIGLALVGSRGSHSPETDTKVAAVAAPQASPLPPQPLPVATEATPPTATIQPTTATPTQTAQTSGSKRAAPAAPPPPLATPMIPAPPATGTTPEVPLAPPPPPPPVVHVAPTPKPPPTAKNPLSMDLKDTN